MSWEKEATLFQTADIIKFGLVLLFVFFLSFFFLKPVPFAYQYQLGGTWNYETLFAPYDIPLVENQEDLMDSLEQGLAVELPAFFLNENMVKRRKRIFERAFRDQIKIAQQDGQFQEVIEQADLYRNFARAFIERAYRKKIIAPLFKAGNSSEDRLILQIRDRQVEISFGDLHTPASVEASVADSLFHSGLEQAEFLLPLLTGFFRPNVKPFRAGKKSKLARDHSILLAGEMIIEKGSQIEAITFAKIKAYQSQHESESFKYLKFIAYFMMASLLMASFYLFRRSKKKHP